MGPGVQPLLRTLCGVWNNFGASGYEAQVLRESMARRVSSTTGKQFRSKTATQLSQSAWSPKALHSSKNIHFHYLFGFAGLGLGFLCSASEHLNSRRANVASSRGILCKATVVMIAKLACPIGQSSYVLLDGILSGYYMIYMLRAPTHVIHFIDL